MAREIEKMTGNCRSPAVIWSLGVLQHQISLPLEWHTKYGEIT